MKNAKNLHFFRPVSETKAKNFNLVEKERVHDTEKESPMRKFFAIAATPPKNPGVSTTRPRGFSI